MCDKIQNEQHLEVEQETIDVGKLISWLESEREAYISSSENYWQGKVHSAAYAQEAAANAVGHLINKIKRGNLNIYADTQQEESSKWHYDDIDSWGAFEEYAGQEVEVWDVVTDKHIAVLRGYRVGSCRPICTDDSDCGNTWRHARVKVYEEGIYK